MKIKKGKTAREFGDFQTPIDLAKMVCDLLYGQGIRPVSILEPTCGRGNFLLAAIEAFDSVREVIGIEINSEYVEYARQQLGSRQLSDGVEIWQGDFFDTNWNSILDNLQGHVLVVGNPPWVTNAELSKLDGKNLPQKTNFHRFSGLDAITGKSNFDISEWMLIQLLNAIDGRDATLAMLCKTAVARKVLFSVWSKGLRFQKTSIYLIDAKRFFNASVSACLFVCHAGNMQGSAQCEVYADLNHRTHETTFALIDNQIIANRDAYDRWKHLVGIERYKWRSGIKHDCSQVMELVKDERGYKNGLKETYDLEDTYLFPLLKSSDVMRSNSPTPKRWMLVTQSFIGESTAYIQKTAPKTWEYLVEHRAFLDNRKSSIYKKRPSFSIFGVGEYSFAPWKVVISGLYKRLHFIAVGPYSDKPVVVDDTCYFTPCRTKEEAEYLAGLLNSEVAHEFFKAFVCWDDKRPITIEILGKLDLLALALELGSEQMIKRFLQSYQTRASCYEQLVLLH